MNSRVTYTWMGILSYLILSACTPSILQRTPTPLFPEEYVTSQDTLNTAKINWQTYFKDEFLINLIDTALENNQELNITLQEIAVSQNEVRIRKGDYLPYLDIVAGAGIEKVGRYTSQGANDANTEIKPNTEFPDPLQDYNIGAYANWEVDIWRKLRNAKRAATSRYLSSIEGRNFMVTNLIAEIANNYFELLALDNELAIIQQNIEIQSNALVIMRLQKQAAKVTELAVRRFEAQVLNTRGRQFDIQQEIVETENRINYLVGRYPQRVDRDPSTFNTLLADTVYAGIPAQLLQNRPDIRQAEKDLIASNLDLKVAKANFYPSLRISAGVGYRAFDPSILIAPESMIYNLAGDLIAPLINRNALNATYYSASARQIQAVINYEQTVLNAYIEVANQVSNMSNLKAMYGLKTQEVEALTTSITISNNLFRSARADYMEVLLTQRDALDSKFDLIETRRRQMNAMVNIYQALGGGWR